MYGVHICFSGGAVVSCAVPCSGVLPYDIGVSGLFPVRVVNKTATEPFLRKKSIAKIGRIGCFYKRDGSDGICRLDLKIQEKGQSRELAGSSLLYFMEN